ncbi:MAG: AAA family ATPase [Candidatus Saccharimonadales bacterium]
MEIESLGYKLVGLSKINVILGKNGCGKSTLLTAVDTGLASQADSFGKSKYITPERGGVLVSEAGVEQQLSSDENYLRTTRNKNQFSQFRQQTVSQYKSLETRINRAVAASVDAKNKTHPKTFTRIISKINSLLDYIEIRNDEVKGTGFRIFNKVTDTPIEAATISSGESELISLAIECLAFAEEIVKGKRNLLSLDEPDVHLHPDLQVRLVLFLIDLVENYDFEIILSTHSTAIVGGLSDYENVTITLMTKGSKELYFEKISNEYRDILPVFGAHPLSNVFNKLPILLVEGEDEVRIWQQAIRSSNGKIKLFPVSCDTVNKMNDYETKVIKIINAVYDEGLAYSLRDRDDKPEDINDLPPLKRMRLSCRTSENLLLTNDVLEKVGIDWKTFESRSDAWLEANKSHEKYEDFKQFKEQGYKRKEYNLKEIRLIVVANIFESNQPWEILVGKAISAQTKTVSPATNSLQDFLGTNTVSNLIP